MLSGGINLFGHTQQTTIPLINESNLPPGTKLLYLQTTNNYGAQATANSEGISAGASVGTSTQFVIAQKHISGPLGNVDATVGPFLQANAEAHVNINPQKNVYDIGGSVSSMAALLQAKLDYSGSETTTYLKLNISGEVDLNALAAGGTAAGNLGYNNGKFNANWKLGAADLIGATASMNIQASLTPQAVQTIQSIQEIAAAASSPATAPAAPWLLMQFLNGGN